MCYNVMPMSFQTIYSINYEYTNIPTAIKYRQYDWFTSRVIDQ